MVVVWAELSAVCVFGIAVSFIAFTLRNSPSSLASHDSITSAVGVGGGWWMVAGSTCLLLPTYYVSYLVVLSCRR